MTLRVVSGDAPLALDAFDSWDMFPPAKGKVWLWSSSWHPAEGAQRAALGDYRVVLSFGPGRGYTMGWAIDAYRASGIPFVDRGITIAEPTHATADRADAEQAALDLVDLDGEGDGGGDEVLLWCDTLLLAVRNLIDAELPAAVPESERFAAMARSKHTLAAPLERPTTTDENRELYETMTAMGLSDHVVETMLFVLVLDDEELELSRNHVTSDDLGDFARLYFLMPSWPQRCAVAYVVQDHDDQLLTDLRLDVLRAPAQPGSPELGLCHIAQATSLAWLRGSIDLAESYLDDPELLARHAAAWADLRPPSWIRKGDQPNHEQPTGADPS